MHAFHPSADVVHPRPTACPCRLQNFPRSYTSNAKVYLVVPGRGNVTMEGVVMCDGVIGYERTSFMEVAYSQVRNPLSTTTYRTNSLRVRLIWPGFAAQSGRSQRLPRDADQE